MDDLISRQAAIDVLEERLHANGYSNVALVSELNRSIGYLMRLPSAQQWIPVTERLPEEEVDVLVTRHFHSDKELRKNGITEKYYVEVASRIDDEWFSYSDEYKIRRQLHEVTAWMPLPEPWKGEER